MLRDALIVGVNTYHNLPGLKAPAKDAEAVAKTLQTYGEFRVHRLPEVIRSGQPQIGQKTQVTLQMLESALIQLFKPKGRSVAQTALFYFSGHGLQREAGIREGFLASSDVDPDRGFYGLSLFWLRRLLQESPVRQRIIILDCCHSGELLNFLEADPGATPGTDRLFMAASREYETAYESLDSSYSVFTQALLTGLDPQRSATGIINHHALTEWINHQLKGEIQQPLFESSGSEIILTRRLAGVDFSGGETNLRRPAAGTVLPCPLPKQTQVHSKASVGCPYRGLECFDEPHAEFFFGREVLTTELLQKLKTHSFVPVVGASGIGKSSLVRAGLIPLLRQSNQTDTDWQIKLLTPGQHPLKSLAAAFVEPDATAIERAEQLRRAEQLLQSGEAGLVHLVRGTMPQHFGITGLSLRRSQPLLIIDQFEEIFTQGQTDWEVQQFIACLMAAVEASCVKVVVVLRSDFVPQCRQYKQLVAQIAQNSIIVPPLKYDQLKAAIVRPAHQAGLRCEPNLVYTLLLDVIGAPGELSLLQSTLLELWQRRQSTPEGTECLTLDSYRELGGIRQLLQERATDIFQCFDTAEQAIAQRIFLALTHFGEGTEDTRRRIFKSQLVSSSSAPDKAQLVERILEKLVSAKLLVTDQAGLNLTELFEQNDRSSHHPGLSDAELFSLRDRHTETAPDWSDRIQNPVPEKATQAVVDVAHEALIRHWTLLRQWCNRDRETLLRQRELEEAAQRWYSAGQPASIEFLLTGRRLEAAEELIATRTQDLAALTQEFILASRKEAKRMQREARQLKIAVPAFLIATLTIVTGQYLNALQSQTEKERELRLATARERAAITQSILQEASSSAPDSPTPEVTAALLIGRLAAQEELTDIAQTSLRLALQSLRLQLELPGSHSSIQQLEISPDRTHLATASEDGKIRLLTIQPHQIYGSTNPPQPGQTLDWTIGTGQGLEEMVSQGTAEKASLCRSIPECHTAQPGSAPVLPQEKPLRFTHLRFSPDSLSIAAAVEGLPDIKVWSTRYGALVLHLKGSAPVTQLRYSPTGEWLVSVHADRSLAIWRSDTGKLQARMLYPKPIDSMQFSADGQVLQVSFAGEIHRYRLLQAANASLSLQPIALPMQVGLTQIQQLKQTVFSEQGRWLATLSSEGQISLWDSQTGQLLRQFSGDQDAKIQFSPNDRTLAILAQNGGWLYDTSTQQLKQLPQLAGKATDLFFSPDGRWFVTRSRQATSNSTQQVIQLWDGRSGELVGILPQNSEVTQVRFSPDNTYLITGNTQGQILFWSVQLGGELPTLAQDDAPTAWIAFLQNGFGQTGSTQLLTIAANGQLQPWRLPPVSATPAKPDRSLPTGVIHTAALKSGNVWQKLRGLAAPSRAKAKAGSSAQSPREQPLNVVEPIQAVPDSQSIFEKAKTGWGATLSQVAGWSSLPPSVADSTLSDRSPLSSVALSADGGWLATADSNGTIALQQRQPNQTFQAKYQIQNWRTGSQIVLSQPMGANVASAHSGESPDLAAPQDKINIRQLHFSPDQRFLLGIGDDLTVRLWNVESGELIQIWSNHRAAIQQARFSPDGLHIITASRDKTAQILQVKSAHSRSAVSSKPSRVFAHDMAVNSSSFSPDNQQIVTGSEDGKARIYDRATGQLQFVLNGHQEAITDVQYSPNGESIVTVSTDGTAIVWNAHTGEQQALLSPARQQDKLQPMRQAAFSPDGQYIATLTQTGQVYLWAATPAHLLTLAQERTPRQLTPEECSRYLNLSFEQCPKLPL